jgi:predicted metal-dependent phosphoesterase TrpH
LSFAFRVLSYKYCVIDLHLHTTASDGRSTPAELVAQAAAAGLTVMAVTDHDTMTAVGEVRQRSAEHGIELVPGIEVTAIESGRDVHVLGYFLDPTHPVLVEFLAQQRQTRLDRVIAIASRLDQLGMPIDLDSQLAQVRAQPERSIGRPQVARAMVAAGHVPSTNEAFDRWLGRGLPAFVQRSGPSPETVVATIQRAGGLASLAHPGRTGIDGRIAALRGAGLDALEVYHSDHDGAEVAKYKAMAGDLGLLMTGGSDFHGDPSYGVVIGGSRLPQDEWERLRAAQHRHVAA